MACIESLGGFIIFFLLILLSFSTTDAIILKSLFRYNHISNTTGDYSEQFYIEHKAFKEGESIPLKMLESIKNIWTAML